MATLQHNARQARDREARLEAVAKLLRQGLSARAIAGRLGLSNVTISSDVKLLMKRWRESALLTVEAAMALDLERVDEVIGALIPAVRTGQTAAIREYLKVLRLRGEWFAYGARSEKKEAPHLPDEADDGYDYDSCTEEELEILQRLELRKHGIEPLE